MIRFLTIAQVARLSGLTRRTIDLRIEKGRISTVLEGSKKMVTLEEFMRNFPNVRSEEIEKELGNKQVVKSEVVEKNDNEIRVKLLEQELKFKDEKILFLEKHIEELTQEVRRNVEERQTLQAQSAQTLQVLEHVLTQKQLTKRTVTNQQKRDSQGRFVKEQ